MVLLRPEDIHENPAFARYKNKFPKRSIKFSDGDLDEYTTDEEEIPVPRQEIIDPSSMTWGPWMLYKTWAAGTSTLSFIDYVGESLASFFGITTPRYYFELEEYKRRKANEEEAVEKEKGWSEMNRHNVIEVPLSSLNTGPSPAMVEEV